MSWKAKGKVLLIKREIFKSECRYQLVVRLKAIKYKKDCLCYLSSTSSFHPVVFSESFSNFLLVLIVRMCICDMQYIGRLLPLDFTKTPSGKPYTDHPTRFLLQIPLLDHLVVTY